jgi:hypothetical protein
MDGPPSGQPRSDIIVSGKGNWLFFSKVIHGRLKKVEAMPKTAA